MLVQNRTGTGTGGGVRPPHLGQRQASDSLPPSHSTPAPSQTSSRKDNGLWFFIGVPRSSAWGRESAGFFPPRVSPC